MEHRCNGRTVSYANGGCAPDPSLPAVVLIHGSGMDRTVWQMQTRFLAHRGFRVVAVDLPGHGGSEGPLLETIPEMGDWLSELIVSMGLEPAWLIGHSMGTFVALEAAARRPELVSGLVLIGTAGAMPVHPELLQSATDDVAHASALMAAWGFGAPAHIGRHASPGMWAIGGSRALVDTSRPDSLAVDMAACNSYRSAVESAAAVTCPVTFLLGSLDKMTPARRARELIEAVPQARTVTLAGVGHMIPIEAPGPARTVILDALTGA